MPRLGIIQDWAAPLLAIAVIAASLVTAITNKPYGLNGAQAAADPGELISQRLWHAAVPVADAPVDESRLTETLGIHPEWVETRLVPAFLDGEDGKLLIVRHFGLSEDKDTHQVAEAPSVFLEKLTVGFQPISQGEMKWQWARFTPAGEPVERAVGDQPLPFPVMLALTTGECEIPRELGVPVSG